MDCPTASVLDWQTKSRDVPHVMFISTLCNSELSEFSFKFISACDRINDALKDIVSKQPTLEFTILYDNVLSKYLRLTKMLYIIGNHQKVDF